MKNVFKRIVRVCDRVLRNRSTSKLFPTRLSWELVGLSRSLTMEAILRGFKDEQEFWETGKKDASKIIRFVDRRSIVLDVGCGIGRVMKYIAPFCKEIHGVDVSALILRRAKLELKESDNCFFHRGDFKVFNAFPANTFDLVYSLYVLQHMEKEDAYMCLLGISRLLKKNGVVYAQFPDFTSNHYFSLFESYALNNSRYGARVRFYTRPEIERLFEGANIRLLEYTAIDENIFVAGVKDA